MARTRQLYPVTRTLSSYRAPAPDRFRLLGEVGAGEAESARSAARAA
ncbi:hypothetical protein BN2537_185 [Streptomyces venezuelae]|nr:hypothetical protein BN2537_185 [Streptomyces venezuelae]